MTSMKTHLRCLKDAAKLDLTSALNLKLLGGHARHFWDWQEVLGLPQTTKGCGDFLHLMQARVAEAAGVY